MRFFHHFVALVALTLAQASYGQIITLSAQRNTILFIFYYHRHYYLFVFYYVIIEPYAIQPGSLTVSGISAGGAMATQFHVAFSKDVNGVGLCRHRVH